MPGAAGRLCHGYGVCTSRGTVPYRTVPYRTTPCLTLQQEHTAKHILPCLSQRKPGGKKAAVGNRRKCGKLCGKRVENSFQGAQAGAGGRGRGGQPDGYFRPGVVRRGRSGGQGRCARAWMRWGRRRFWRRPGAAEHGAVPTGGMCGRGVGLRPGAVRRVLSAGAGVVDAFGWRVVAAVRCWTRVQRRARWLAFLPREKMLDKLCKSILNWKQGITQAAAGDGLRHRPHRRSCSVYPTSTSSVAAWPPRHLPRIAKGDARSHPRRALPPSGSPAGVRIPRPPHPSRRLRSCAARSTRAFPALPSAKRRRKTPPRIEPMLGGVL